MSDRLENIEVANLAQRLDDRVAHGVHTASNSETADLLTQAAEALRELAWQRGWWEGNYGNNVMYAPSRKFNQAFMDALDKHPSHQVPEIERGAL